MLRLLEVMGTHHDYPKASSFSIPCLLRLLLDHAQETPASSLHHGAPASWQSRHMAGASAQKPQLFQQQLKHTLQLPVLSWRNGRRQQVLSMGPRPSPQGLQQYVPVAPTATNSKEKPSECNFLICLQFLSQESEQN